MDKIEAVGFGIWLIGAGLRGLPGPNMGLMGSIAMVAGGVVFLIGVLV